MGAGVWRIGRSNIDKAVAKADKAAALFVQASEGLDESTVELLGQASHLEDAIEVLVAERQRALDEAGRNGHLAEKLREFTR